MHIVHLLFQILYIMFWLQLLYPYNLLLQVFVYCDFHGHSRKSNVFMYGNSTVDLKENKLAIREFLNERMLPFIISQLVCIKTSHVMYLIMYLQSFHSVCNTAVVNIIIISLSSHIRSRITTCIYHVLCVFMYIMLFRHCYIH